MKRNRVFASALTSFFLAGLLLTSCSRSEREDEEQTAEKSDKRRIEVSEEVRKECQVGIAVAEPVVLKKTVKLNGKIGPNEERMVQVSPRFPGVVKSISKRLGDHVAPGEALALIESNESLQSYEVKSEIEGTIIKKDIALGEFIDTSKTIFIVADLRTVWVDFSVYRHESENLHEGQKVLVQAIEGPAKVESTISYLSPFGLENTQTTLARVVIPNANGEFRPGLFVEGKVVVAELPVPVAVKASAIQTIEEKPVVFVQIANGFEEREIKSGEADDDYVEIKSGIAAGEKYAAENSFFLKSELAKPAPGEE